MNKIKNFSFYVVGVLLACSAAAYGHSYVQTSIPGSKGIFQVQVGVASWYGKRFHNKMTANGEMYDMFELTAAHKSLPLGSVVRVTNLENSRSVIVRINDRGPFIKGRIIDVSLAAACRLRMVEDGITKVKVEVVTQGI